MITKKIDIMYIYGYLKWTLVSFSKIFYGRKILKIYEDSDLQNYYKKTATKLNSNNFLNFYYFFYNYFIINNKYINKINWDFIADKYKLNFINFLN